MADQACESSTGFDIQCFLKCTVGLTLWPKNIIQFSWIIIVMVWTLSVNKRSYFIDINKQYQLVFVYLYFVGYYSVTLVTNTLSIPNYWWNNKIIKVYEDSYLEDE